MHQMVLNVSNATNTSNASFDEPPSFRAALTASPISLAFSLILLPSSPSITILTTSSTLSAATTSCRRSHSLTTTPTFNPSASSLVLAGWSECIGQAITGTPQLTASMHEFHPQWLMNPPVARWANTSSCGTHPLTTFPTPSTAFSNPADSRRLLLSKAKMSARSASRRTQRKRCPLRRSPEASCSACSSEIVDMVPKDTYTTEQGGCPSSHSKHSSRLISVLLCICINRFI
ncbi:hypothetical protein IEQ34_007819 [Dendrobium chrysotoxum]|uniref:Uncharacterized protein n=1 Tax=Dendrobium chrysotoxum TaxID=161865 RepID=A0AAV7H4J6_DENCH|nr:hypothetical protein IEQ34_007819 [Dendrobium chrysotoxum]